MKSEVSRIDHEQKAMKEKIKVNKLPVFITVVTVHNVGEGELELRLLCIF